MTNISRIFEDIYLPTKAILIYQPFIEGNHNVYVESHDIDENGSPVNAHPLSINEAAELAESLTTSPEMKQEFLQPKGLLPENVLRINCGKNGFALWYTPAQKVQLFFTDKLNISSGKAALPALVWKATKSSLYIYALKENKKPNLKTSLHYAPFFNIYKDGKVCMGTVDIELNNRTRLEDFIQGWQHYFFNSYFSHLLDDYCPVSMNIIQLWQQQVNGRKKFPVDVLIKTNKTIKDLLS